MGLYEAAWGCMGFMRLEEVAMGLKIHSNIGLHRVAWGCMGLHEVA